MLRNGKVDNLIEIFFNTKNQYESNVLLKKKCRYSLAHQIIYKEQDSLNVNQNLINKYQNEAKVIVSNKRTFDAAGNYKGLNTVVLNFASLINPGGGVLHGSSAQEECLCRCSTLYYNLDSKQCWDEFYSPHRNIVNDYINDDIIYTPEVIVFKSDELFPETLSPDKWYQVNVISCAAPDLYSAEECGVVISPEELILIHKKKLQRILEVALINGNEVVILGAFGCGAFGNPPEIVAQVAKEVISGFMYAFKVIEFAVYCSPDKQENYKEFKKTIK